MSSQIIIPKNPQLKKYIEYFWLLDGSQVNGNCPTIIYPETRYDMIIDSASPVTWKSQHAGCIESSGSYICGIKKEPYVLHCHGKAEYLAIRFYAHGLFPFLNFPLSEISDQNIELELLEGKFWKKLKERIKDFPCPESKIDFLESQLIARLNAVKLERSWIIESALLSIQSTKGAGNIHTISNQLGTYTKKIEREFKKYIGITPKYYSRIVRFNAIIDHLKVQKEDRDWMDVVYDFGYFDQSHFIREFKSFLGFSPEAFLKFK